MYRGCELNYTYVSSTKIIHFPLQIDGCVVRTSGEPGRAIIKIARGEGADYIVMGSRGLGTLRKTFMGSVSDYIVHHAHIPVTVVRNRDEDNK